MNPTERASASLELSAPSRPRAPVAGIVAGLALAAGLGLWTFQRISEAKSIRSDVETRRAADGERALALAREPQSVRVVRGTPERWLARVDLDGTLEAQHSAELGFKVGGRLSRVDVEVGDRVRAGAVLGLLDQREEAARATATEAQVRAAEASLDLAEDAERRTLPLVQNGSMAVSSGVQASSQVQLAKAQLDAARAQLSLARSGVDNHTLLAPFGGTILRAPSGVGAVVTSGQALFALADTSTLRLSTTVSEADANLLSEGAEIVIVTENGQVRGRVTAILSTLDARTRRVPVVAEFDNFPKEKTPKDDAAKHGSRALLRAGAFVRASVAAQRELSVLRVPHGVLRPGSQDEVLRVTPDGARLEARRIVYSIAPDGALLVRSGIEANDELVLDPIAEAKSGDAVRVERAGADVGSSAATPAAEAVVAPQAGTR
jgi:RND family efflux transporter MFP subunit